MHIQTATNMKKKMFTANADRNPTEDIIIQIQEGNETITREIRKLEVFEDKVYISQTRTISIIFEYKIDWFEINLQYKELPFAVNIVHKWEDAAFFHDNILGSNSEQPNSVSILKLYPQEGRWNVSSVMLTVKYLDIGETDGNYMLIGAGAEPFEGPPAIFLTEKFIKSEKYYVMEDNAYIVIYYASGSKPRFHISWQRDGNRINEPDDTTEDLITDSVLQAVPVCFYNSSWIEKFNHTTVDDDLEEFLEKFAGIANNYIKEKNLKIMQKIGSRNILLLYVSSLTPPDEDHENGVIHVMITTVQSYDSRMAIFRWQQMEQLVTRYGAYDDSKDHPFGFKVGKCISGVNYKWWYVTNAMLIFLCIIFFLAVWFAAYISKKKWKKLDKVSQIFGNLYRTDSSQEKTENYYAYENPCLILTDEDENLQQISETSEGKNNWTLKKRRNSRKLSVTSAISLQNLEVPHHEKQLQRLWKKYIPLESPRQITAEVHQENYSNAKDDTPENEMETNSLFMETKNL